MRYFNEGCLLTLLRAQRIFTALLQRQYNSFKRLQMAKKSHTVVFHSLLCTARQMHFFLDFFGIWWEVGDTTFHITSAGALIP